jgi:hypothetical protein
MIKRKLWTIGLPAVTVALIAGIGIASAASGLAGGANTNGGGPGGPGGGAGVGFGGGFATISPSDYATNQATEFQNEASALGLSASIVTDGWAKGESIMQIATDNGIGTSTLQSDLKTYQQSQLTAQLQALVTNGTITQDQMNTRLAFEEQQATQAPMSGGQGSHGPPGQRPDATSTAVTQ